MEYIELDRVNKYEDTQLGWQRRETCIWEESGGEYDQNIMYEFLK